MNVLSFFVLKKLRRRSGLLADLLQPLQDGDQFARRKHSRRLQSLSIGPACRQFVFEQPAVEVERTLPMFEAGVQRLPEPARPHFHFNASFTFSACTCAYDREGSPRMRMKPSASF